MLKNFLPQNRRKLLSLANSIDEAPLDSLTLGLDDPASYWREVVESAGLGVWDYNIVTGEKRYSTRWREMRHLAPGDPLHASDEDWFALIHPDDLAVARENTALINSGKADVISFEYRERIATGRWMWIMCRGRALHRDSDGRATRFMGIDSDITAVKEVELARELSAKQLEIAVAMAGIGIWRFEFSTESLSWDARLRAIYGVPEAQDPLPRDIWERSIHPEDLERVLVATRDGTARKADYRLDYRIVRADGEVRHIRSQVGFVNDGLSGLSILGLNWDVTDDLMQAFKLDQMNRLEAERLAELSKAQEELEYLSRHDPLTGLPNRRSLQEYLDRLQSGQPPENYTAFIVLDIDQFKTVNDTRGHAFGDKLLSAVAGVLDGEISSMGILARTGGDEFLAVIGNVQSPEVPMAIATSAIAKAREVSRTLGQEITLSAGIDIGHTGTKSEDELLNGADRAMYQAKKMGGSRAVLAGGMVLIQNTV